MRAGRSIQLKNQPDSHSGHTNIALPTNTAPDIADDAPKSVVVNNDHGDHNSTMAASSHLPPPSTASLSPRLHQTTLHHTASTAVTKAPSLETIPDTRRPRPTPPGYLSKTALAARAAAEAAAAAEAERLAGEAERLAGKAEHLAGEAERLTAEAAAAVQAEHLAGEAAATNTQAAQAAIIISTNTQAASPIIINTPFAATAGAAISPVACPRRVDARLPLTTFPFNIETTDEAAPARARRVITQTVAGIEVTRAREAQAKKSAETKAKKADKVSGKRVATGDDGPAKKKSRVSKKETGDGDVAGAKKKKPRAPKKIAAQS